MSGHPAHNAPPRGTPSHLPPASDMLGHPSCLGAHTPGLTTCPSHALAHSGGWDMFPGGWELEDLPGAAACRLPPAPAWSRRRKPPQGEGNRDGLRPAAAPEKASPFHPRPHVISPFSRPSEKGAEAPREPRNQPSPHSHLAAQLSS